MKTTLTLAVVAAIGIASALHAQQVRDSSSPAAPTKAGTGVISGAVVTDEQAPQPIRRAAVSVVNVDGSVARSTFTDDAGRFTLTALPEGRYTLSATKAPYLRTNYGAKRYDFPATPITLKDGGRMSDIALKMQRGGVLSGRITDENGEPAFGVSVRVLQLRMQFGERTFVPVASSGLTNDVTDDKGVYRLFGLPPGEYTVSATPRTSSGEIRAMTDQEIREIMQQLQQQQQQQAASQSMQSTSPAGQPPPNASQPPQQAPSDLSKVTVAFTPVFYPGTTVAASASTVSIGPGEERTGIDIALRLVRTSTIEGVVVPPADVAPQAVQILMVPSSPTGSPAGLEILALQRASVGPDGRFKYTGVAPGQYTISAQVNKPAGGVPPPPPPPPPPPGGAVGAPGQVMTFTRTVTAGGGGEMPMDMMFLGAPGGGNGTPYWAQADVSVDGAPVSGVTLSLQPGMTMTGRVEFKSANMRSSDPKRVQLMLVPAPTGGGPRISTSQPTMQIDETGKFTITGVVPGRYRLSGNAPIPAGSGPGAPWRLGSAVVKGRDILDFPLDVAPGDQLTDVVVTFTDATQSIGGSLQDESGRPAPDYTIVVFAADKAYWTPSNRRVRTVRPGTDGRFTVANLPPGDYRMAAVVDLAPTDVNDPSFLEQIVGASFPITLGVGENKTQDLKIKGGL
ncbi:MAG TPA: carboxypeptidase regulatory-like domain-containing protein [Vicinamibacterales bacterium]|nr:carboxypeptidase regulatory-like domain-containing protein [Vicinamibacterales bacterium]